MVMIMLTKSSFEKLFFGENFQSEWKTYKNLFGEELDSIFGEDYEHKYRLGQALRRFMCGELYSAYQSLRDLEEYCVDEEDHRLFDRIMTICRNREDMDRIQVGDWVKLNVGTTTPYYRVVRRTAEGVIIKRGFFGTPDKKGWRNPFQYGITNLDAFQCLDEQETASVRDFFAEHPHEAEQLERQTDAMVSYRQTALDQGLQEGNPLHAACMFYKLINDRTAFVLNVSDAGDCIQVVYGFTEVRNVEYFTTHTLSDTDILLRHVAIIRTEEDEAAAAEKIRLVFDKYQSTSVEELSAIRAEREKAFLAHVHARLHQIGMEQQDMKNQDSKWRKDMEQGLEAIFMAFREDRRDLYSFDVFVRRIEASRSRCFHQNFPHDSLSRVDPQLMTEQELDALLDLAIEDCLLPILQNPLSILGKDPMIWAGCTCNRRECGECWIEKNMFEARGE